MLPRSGDPVRGILPTVIAWLGEGHPVALARVVEVVGSGVQPAGAALAVSASGQVVGSASGGCVEGALVEQARAALSDDGRPRLTTFGCTGFSGGKLRTLAQKNLHVPLDDMGIVESIHLTAFHWVIDHLHGRIAG